MKKILTTCMIIFLFEFVLVGTLFGDSSRKYHFNMIHGIKSDGDSWNGTKVKNAIVNDLKSFSNTQMDYSNLYENYSIPSIASHRNNDFCVADCDETVVVAHSMGGLVTRSFIQNNVKNNLSSLITIGTPHLGANIASTNGTGVATDIINELIFMIWDGVKGYLKHNADLNRPYLLQMNLAYNTIDYNIGSMGGASFLEYVIANSSDAVADFYMNNFSHPSWPSSQDMVPGSSFISNLNGNQSMESYINRYAIYGEEDFPQFYRLLASAINLDEDAFVYGIEGLLLSLQIVEYWSYVHMINFNFWSDLAISLYCDQYNPFYGDPYYIHAFWWYAEQFYWAWDILNFCYDCYRILDGIPGDWNDGVVGGSPNDGVVKGLSQKWPNILAEYNYKAEGANHLEEANNNEVKRRLLEISDILKLKKSETSEYQGKVINGTIGNNVCLKGIYRVTGDLTVPSGKTVTIAAGTKFNFESDKKITVNGTLISEGNSSHPIIFQSYSAQEWGGIKLINASSNSILDYCEIKNATTGILVQNSSPTIKNSHIHSNGNGIYLSSSSIPLILNNTIESNSINGVVSSSYSSPDFVNVSSYPHEHGYNIIRNNGNDGVISSYDANTLLGVYTYDGFGKNSIYGNNGYNLKVYSGGYSTARFCWWGQYPADDTKFYGYSSQYVITNAQQSFPGGGSSLAKSMSYSGKEFDPEQVDENNPEELFELATYNYYQGNIKNSIKIHKDIIKRFPESNITKQSLIQVYTISKKKNIKGSLPYFNSNKKNKYNNEIKGCLNDLLILSYCDEKKYDEVERICNESIENFSNSKYEMFALYHLVLLYNNEYSDKDGAEKYLNIMKEKYSDSDLTLNAQELIGEKVDWTRNIAMSKQSYKENGYLETPSEFNLNPAYPNPFNPTTTISFSLAKQSKVDIKIYNLSGKKVWEYDNKLEFGIGNHRVVWNALDASGNPLSTGVYFIRLQSGNNIATQKVIFMK